MTVRLRSNLFATTTTDRVGLQWSYSSLSQRSQLWKLLRSLASYIITAQSLSRIELGIRLWNFYWPAVSQKRSFLILPACITFLRRVSRMTVAFVKEFITDWLGSNLPWTILSTTEVLPAPEAPRKTILCAGEEAREVVPEKFMPLLLIYLLIIVSGPYFKQPGWSQKVIVGACCCKRWVQRVRHYITTHEEHIWDEIKKISSWGFAHFPINLYLWYANVHCPLNK